MHFGFHFFIYIFSAGNVVCSWGREEDGQLGHGDAEDRLAPTQLSALDGQEMVSLTCGADNTTAFSESSLNVYSSGDGMGDFGRLGHGNSTDFFIPQPIKALQGLRIRQIVCGDSHCLAVSLSPWKANWGQNQNGQLGIGTIEDSLVPQKIEAFQGITVKMVPAGAEHTVAITEDGDLYGVRRWYKWHVYSLGRLVLGTIRIRGGVRNFFQGVPHFKNLLIRATGYGKSYAEKFMASVEIEIKIQELSTKLESNEKI
ncbi:hypothetical protein LXL04_003578 [Taraxacum kok-saghyz]